MSSRYNYVNVPILNYHHFVVDELPSMDYKTTEKKFITDIKSLISEGYKIISLRDLITSSDYDPHKSVVITADDGYRSNYEILYPIISQLSVPVTLFVIVDMIGESVECTPHFTIKEANMMTESGLVSIQSHGLTHEDLRVLSDSWIGLNLRVSKDFLSSVIKNNEIWVYSYPNEKFSEKTLTRVLEFYEYQMISIFDLTSDYVKRYNCLGRISVGFNDSIIDLVNLYHKKSDHIIDLIEGR